MLARADAEWVGVYPFLSEDDFSYLKQLAQKLTNNLQCGGVAVMLPKPSQFRFAVLQGDHLLTEYDSETCLTDRPDFAELMKFCKPSTPKRELQELFIAEHSEARSGDRLAQGLSEFLDIPRAQLCTGFNYLKWAQAGR